MLESIFGGDELPNLKVYEMAQKVIRDYMDKKRVKIERVACELGTTKGYLYASLDPHQNTRPLSIDRIVAITKLTGDTRILQELCKEFDLVCIKKPTKQPSTVEINILVDNAAVENFDVFKVSKEALKDGQIDEGEQKAILKEIDEADGANAQLRSVVELLGGKK